MTSPGGPPGPGPELMITPVQPSGSSTVQERMLASVRRSRRMWVLAGVLAAAVFAVLPTFLNSYAVLIFMLTLLWMGLALSWAIFSGFTGYMSFGHAALLGLGAYGVGIGLNHNVLPLWALVIVVSLGCGLVSLIFGAMTLRVSGPYFAIATLGVAQGILVLVESANGLTGGVNGLLLPYKYAAQSLNDKYFAILAVTVLTTIVAAAILWTRFGTRLLAIREDEVAAEGIGINTSLYKVAAFVVSGTLTGAFGGLYGWVLGFLTPDSLLTPLISLQISVMAIVGGMGTVAGPLLGGCLIYLLNNYTLSSSPFLPGLIEGGLLIVVILLFRGGIVGWLQRLPWWPKGFRA
jgi:branched-chain amino acid transport system permease protein